MRLAAPLGLMKKPQRSHGSAPQAVRIIGGQWRRSILPIIDAEGLRPTPARVRETVFNWLNHFNALDAAEVLDVFAGSGALGLEAASRGARRVVLLDRNPKAVAALGETIARLKAENVSVECQDALAYLKGQSSNACFHLVFLDPPFHAGWLERLLPWAVRVLLPGGFLYIESERALEQSETAPLGLELLRADKAGQVVYHLLRRNIDAAGCGPKNEEEEAC
jgi:16S rRNA (guanine(966)-N(2))-methyltransferase RsmD